MDLPPPYYSTQAPLPAFTAIELDWPTHLHFRRAPQDTSTVHVFVTDSTVASPILTISRFILPSYSFLEYKSYNFQHIYPGVTPGCEIQDNRGMGDDPPFVTKLILPALGSSDDSPRKQKFVYQGTSDAHTTIDYVVQDASEKHGIEGVFEVDGFSFRWVLVKNAAGGGSSSSSSSPSLGSSEDSICHELRMASEKSWITVATASVQRHSFYNSGSVDDKSGVYGSKPLFAQVDFAVDKMCLSSKRLTVVAAVLWGVWMGDALNKAGRLADCFCEE
ncbi:hypothetical protein HDU98_009984 [Podochytrium sp. JEL0797]|nr:hypothetical protein HDU98_009984 [Podochytrium sp. JEL0797]